MHMLFERNYFLKKRINPFLLVFVCFTFKTEMWMRVYCTTYYVPLYRTNTISKRKEKKRKKERKERKGISRFVVPSLPIE